jgi:hypothetical protein
MNMPRWLIAPFAASLVFLAVACGGDDKDNDSANASTGGGGSAVSRELNLANAAQALQDVKSFRFDMSLKMDFDAPSGGSDEDEFGAALLALFGNISAKGAFAGPDSFEAEASLLGQKMKVVQIGDQAWVNDGSGWEVTDAEDMSMFTMTSPADLFEMVPAEVLKNATIKSEKVNGQETTRYSFNKDQLVQLAKDLGEEMVDIDEIERMNLDVWLTKDYIPVKMVMDMKGEAEGTKAEIKMEFNVTDLNDPNIKIQKPI